MVVHKNLCLGLIWKIKLFKNKNNISTFQKTFFSKGTLDEIL